MVRQTKLLLEMRHNTEIGVLVLWLFPGPSPTESSLAFFTQCLSRCGSGRNGYIITHPAGTAQAYVPLYLSHTVIVIKGGNYV